MQERCCGGPAREKTARVRCRVC
ncbi:hypothetical protein LEMLEM_LOCUS8607 [Lemmus lemmus]